MQRPSLLYCFKASSVVLSKITQDTFIKYKPLFVVETNMHMQVIVRRKFEVTLQWRSDMGSLLIFKYSDHVETESE